MWLLTLGLVSGLGDDETSPPVPGPDRWPQGAWAGEIELPGTRLEIRVELKQKDGDWTGVIEIPVQGVHGFELGGIGIDGSAARFQMPGIPGDPTFDGTIAEDGESLSGTFSQGGQTYPFRLARTEAAPQEPDGVPGEGFAGDWRGSLRVGLLQLRLVFHFEGEDDALSGTLDSVDQHVTGIPIREFAVDGRRLVVDVATIGGRFEGVLNDDGSELRGEWTQGGQAWDMVLKRLDGYQELSRPQEPKPPYPYHEEEVTFLNDRAGIRLAGTLTVPEGEGPFPAAVLLSGSGAQDRDEALMGHRPFFVLADHLTRNGIAVLRFDDRGFGESEGRYSTATNMDFVGDALAAIEFMKARPNVDPARVGLIGHSEGGVTAPRAAIQARGADVAFLVFLAGVGVPMDELLVRQTRDLLIVMGADEASIAKQEALQREIFTVLRDKGIGDEARKAVADAIETSVAKMSDEERDVMGVTDGFIKGQVQMVVSPWFFELLSYDPAPILKQVRCPVLAMCGEKDIQVAFKENLEGIEHGVRSGGNDQVTIRAFPGLNHLFQTCKTGAVAEYGTIEETFNPAALEAVSAWVLSVTGGKE